MWHLTQNREGRVLFSNHPYGSYIFTEFCFAQCTITVNYVFHSKTNLSTHPIPSLHSFWLSLSPKRTEVLISWLLVSRGGWGMPSLFAALSATPDSPFDRFLQGIWASWAPAHKAESGDKVRDNTLRGVTSIVRCSQLHSRMACNEDIKEPAMHLFVSTGNRICDFGYLFLWLFKNPELTTSICPEDYSVLPIPF